eukprot:scaffold3117_cov139-Skeletonema_dohrnii-CCMP3373.AAC.1
MHSAALISRSNAKKITSLLVIAVLIVLICDRILFQLYHIKTATYHTLSWMYKHDTLVLGLHILSMILLTRFFAPPALLVLASGFIFKDIYVNEGWSYVVGLVIAWLASMLGAVIGGTLAFSRAPGLSGDLLEVLIDRYPILNVVDKAITNNSLRVMMLLRLNPFLPFGVLNYVFAMKGVDMGLFVAAMASVVQWYLFLVCIGAGLSSMYNGYGSIDYAIGTACGALVMVTEWWFAKGELLSEVGEAKSDGRMKRLAAILKLTKASRSRSRSRSRSPVRGRSRSRSMSRSRSRSNSRRRCSTPSRSKQSEVPDNIVEDSDLSSADYVRMQILGDDTDYVGRNIYRDNLDLTEIILDNFS